MLLNIVLGGSSSTEINGVSDKLSKLGYKVNITGVFTSVRESKTILNSGPAPDLFFLDTDLSDGKSISMLTGGLQDVPVIFFGASLQDAVCAFRFNAIDYLLKPVRKANLSRAMEKFIRIYGERKKNEFGAGDRSDEPCRQRIIIKNGNRFQFRPVRDVALFYADGKSVYLVTRNDGRKYLIDHTLEQLERSLQPDAFFRISRQHIVPVDCIAEVRGLISGKLAVRLNQATDQELSVSRERAPLFKRWLDR